VQIACSFMGHIIQMPSIILAVSKDIYSCIWNDVISV
jgi:hypothetical protein